MRTRTPITALSIGLIAAAALTGCTSVATGAVPSLTPSDAAPVEPAPTLTPNPPEPDSMLWIRATATATNGAKLSLEAMVHRSVSYEYPGTQTLNTMLIEDCGATLTNAIVFANKWSITRMNTTAIPPVDSAPWPEDARIGFRPSADNVYMASRGMIAADATTGDLACVQDKYFAGSGKGAFAVGIPGDTIDLDHFGNAWAGHTWGFVAPAGVTLTDCSFEITDLAKQFGSDAAGWVQTSDANNCYIGPASESSIF